MCQLLVKMIDQQYEQQSKVNIIPPSSSVGGLDAFASFQKWVKNALCSALLFAELREFVYSKHNIVKLQYLLYFGFKYTHIHFEAGAEGWLVPSWVESLIVTQWDYLKPACGLLTAHTEKGRACSRFRKSSTLNVRWHHKRNIHIISLLIQTTSLQSWSEFWPRQ